MKFRILAGVIIEVDAINKEDAARKAGKIMAGVGFNFRGDGFDKNATYETKLLNVERVEDGPNNLRRRFDGT